MYGSVSAQRWFVSQNQPNERVVGLLDLRDVTENYTDDACGSKRISVQLYDNPSTAGAAIGAIYMRRHPEHGCVLLFKRAQASGEEELPTEESGYEIAAAVVHERRGRWFRIAEWRARVPQQIGIEVVGMTRVGNEDSRPICERAVRRRQSQNVDTSPRLASSLSIGRDARSVVLFKGLLAKQEITDAASPWERHRTTPLAAVSVKPDHTGSLGGYLPGGRRD